MKRVFAHHNMICIEGDTYAKNFHLTDGTEGGLFKSMKFYAPQLPKDCFLHGHQSFIINLKQALYYWTVGGFIEVYMSNKRIARVMRDYFWTFNNMRANFPNLKTH